MDVGGGEKRPLEDANGEEPSAKRFQGAPLGAQYEQTPVPMTAQAPPGPAALPDLSALAALSPDMLAQLPALLQALQGESADATNALTAQLLASVMQGAPVAAGGPVASVPGMTPAEASDPNHASNLLTAQLLASALGGQAPAVAPAPMEPEPVSLSLGCPVAHVGRIIGKGGEMIKNLQKTFMVKIQIDQKTAGITERRIHITGPQANAQAAYDRIQSMISQGIAQAAEESMGAASTPAPMPVVNPGHTVQKITCPDEQVGRVIGRGGENIRQTEAATGAKVQVARWRLHGMVTEMSLSGIPQFSTSKVNQKTVHGLPREVTITGSPADVSKAAAIVTALMNGESIANAARTKIVNGDSKEVIACPRDKVGRVIGKGGENIRLMEEKSGGTDIQIDQKSMPPGAPCLVTITGNPTSVAYAKQLVQTIIDGGLASVQQMPVIGTASASSASQYSAYGPGSAAPSTTYQASTTAPGSSTASASGWTEYKDKDGNSYYHNHSTGVTQWEKPPGF